LHSSSSNYIKIFVIVKKSTTSRGRRLVLFQVLPWNLLFCSRSLTEVVLVLFLPFRFDLVLIANGRKEKFASGLLKPFLAHLKAAQDQIAKGGYSITLEPNSGFDVPWFTRGTVERLASRFLYYCSTVTPGIAYLPVGSFLCQLFADLCVS